MKKLFIVFLSTVFLLALAACSSDKPSTQTADITTTTTTDSTTEITVSSTTTSTKARTTTSTTTTTKEPTTTSSTTKKPTATTSTTKKINPTGPSWGPKFILNGQELDVYTSHYFIKEDYVEIPLTAFLASIGAKYADSPFNSYDVECYSFMGKRYIVSGTYHLFMLEEDYIKLTESVKSLTRENTENVGLLPRVNNICWANKSDSVQWGEIWIDHISLMNALKESGIDITIDCDYKEETLLVTLKE